MKTKKLLLCSVALCYTTVGFAQHQNGFQSFFGLESTEWNGVTEYYDVPWENQLLRITNDTLISDMYFKKVEYSAVYWHNGYSEGRDSSLDFFLREDTATGKLWCRFPDGNADLIIADMSLSIGDTIYEFTERSIMFIEGVGCSNLLDYLRLHIIGSRMVCCHKDGELIYHYSMEGWSEEDCVVRPVGINDCVENQKVHIWPNPCNDWIYINSDEYIESAKIYDMMGHLILDNISCKDKVCIKNLPQGIYLLFVETNYSKSQIKIIKQ